MSETQAVIMPEITDALCLAFWEGLKDGVILLGHCNDCGKYHHYPRVRCPHCFSNGVQMSPASGNGTVDSFTTVYRAARPGAWDAPFLIALVRLSEGPVLLSALAGAEDDYAIGANVTARFRTVGSDEKALTLHFFELSAAAPGSDSEPS